MHMHTACNLFIFWLAASVATHAYKLPKHWRSTKLIKETNSLTLGKAIFYAATFRRRYCLAPKPAKANEFPLKDFDMSREMFSALKTAVNDIKYTKLLPPPTVKLDLSTRWKRPNEEPQYACLSTKQDLCTRAQAVITLRRQPAISTPILEQVLGHNQKLVEDTRRRFIESFVNDVNVFSGLCMSSLARHLFSAEALVLKSEISNLESV